MKFPGSKLVYSFDLAVRSMPLDELLRSCRQVGLTGFAELETKNAVGMIFYYMGSEANALFRDANTNSHGSEALTQFGTKVEAGEGTFSVYELPLDMAHLLRGITNRRKLPDTLERKADLDNLLEKMEVTEHTGTIEIQTPAGAGMILLIRGRVSNLYWETSEGLTFEKGDARQRLEGAFGKGKGRSSAFLSDFSTAAWKGRHEVETSVRSRFSGTPSEDPAEQLAEDRALRESALDQLQAQVPALMDAFMFDLMTGVVLARRGRGTDSLRVALLAEKVPPLTMYLRDLVATAQDDEVEIVEMQTARTAVLVALVAETQEAVAVLADKSQPTALIGAALTRVVRSYAAALQPLRGGLAAR